ncbi:hypothetical protein QVD17_39852 [Tagetes erecta]|uniref:NLP1-9 GAF domain-containing protein n=1 Tax=Tagetes erecta TaxID=13708 RepID=A0AAD8JPA3_TARER|nr:hypothetical protein QVD17_39852 [Tagetes erecta]
MDDLMIDIQQDLARMICEKIKAAFSNMLWLKSGLICQFWAPVTIDGRRLLSTSGQPFAVSDLSDNLAMYRINSAKYHYNIDMNTLDIERDTKIMSGGPATAFLNRMPYVDEFVGSPLEPCGSTISILLPICFPSQSSCIGVVECTINDRWPYDFSFLQIEMKRGLKDSGVEVFDVQELIPYKTISGLEPVRDEITKALQIVCGSHNLTLAQVWIAYEDENNVSGSSSLENTGTKRMLALKLTGYHTPRPGPSFWDLGEYYRLCDMVPLENKEEHVLKTLQDYKSRYISKVRPGRLMSLASRDMVMNASPESSAFTICLRSIDTGDINYVFEFIWLKHSNYVIFLEAILLTLKRCLPSFKFTSGVELGDELDVIDVENYVEGETNNFKIFQGLSPIAEAIEEGRTTEISLPREVIEKQFEKTMKAAKNLNVSLSTLKRKLSDHGISEWQGPRL